MKYYNIMLYSLSLHNPYLGLGLAWSSVIVFVFVHGFAIKVVEKIYHPLQSQLSALWQILDTLHIQIKSQMIFV